MKESVKKNLDKPLQQFLDRIDDATLDSFWCNLCNFIAKELVENEENDKNTCESLQAIDEIRECIAAELHKRELLKEYGRFEPYEENA